jgi:hypothetical protein
MSKTFPEKIDKIFDVIFWVVLSRFWVFRSDGSSKTPTKNLQKIVSKSLTKKSTKIPNRFFVDFFSHVFGRFLVRGVQKHHTKILK